MLRRYGAGVLAGTHSATYSCTIPSLIITAQARFEIPSATEKHGEKQFGFRAFYSSSPKLWISLPQTIRAADSSATFRRLLKTHLFSDRLSFSVSAGLTGLRNFSMSSQDFFLCFCLVFLLKKNLLPRTEHSSQWTQALKKS